jgi:hypothetical protein
VRGAPRRNPGLRSGRQNATALAAPAGHDRTPGAGTHPQTETMHTGSAPVVGLEGPLALGHGVLLVVSGSGIRAIRPHTLRNEVGPRGRPGWVGACSCYWPARSPSLSFGWQFGSQPYRRLSGDFLRVLTCLRRVKPGLPQRTTHCHPKLPDSRSASIQMNPAVMAHNCWQPNRKLLASVSDWSGGRQTTQGWQIGGLLDDLHGLSPERGSRAVAAKAAASL